MQPTGDPSRVYLCTTAGTSLARSPAATPRRRTVSRSTDGSGAAGDFQACYRFTMTVTLSSPQPAQVGYIYVHAEVRQGVARRS